MNFRETSGAECVLLRAETENAAATQSIYGGCNRITCVDRAVISRYFEDRRMCASVPASELSSRSRRRWIIGGRLPAALHAVTLHEVRLPRQLESKLSTLDAGYERLLTGGDILCIEIASLRIVDVMRNAGAAETQDTAQLLVDCGVNRTATYASGLCG
jgi:hypothetical protein